MKNDPIRESVRHAVRRLNELYLRNDSDIETVVDEILPVVKQSKNEQCSIVADAIMLLI